MIPLKAIYKREIRAYFTSPTGYIFIGFTLLLGGFFFTITNLEQRMTDISMFFQNISIVLLFLVPLLTMRLIAEERRAKTDQLLFTSPVTSTQIILGKYFAAVTVFAVSLVIMGVYPLILVIFGQPSVGSIISLFVGYFLMGSALIALGVFASALTESQMVAAVISFSFLLLLWLANGLTGLFTSDIYANIVSFVSVLSRFSEFVYGDLTLTGLIYFISFAAIFLFLATVKLDGKFLRKWGSRVPITVSVICAIAVVNLGLQFVMDKYNWNLRLDLTETKVFTLSQESKEILKDIDKDVQILSFYLPENQDEIMNRIVDKYDSESGHITSGIVNPEIDPLLVEKYSSASKTVTEGSVVVTSGDRFVVLGNSEFYGSSTGMYADTLIAEEKITAAITSVTSNEQLKIGVAMGHGGKVTEDTTVSDIAHNNGYELVEVNTILGEIPEDIAVLMIIAPRTDFAASEIDSLDRFLASGRGLQVYLDVETPNLPNLQGYLSSDWGLEFQRNLVVETDAGRVLDRYPTTLVPNVGYHAITEAIASSNISIIVPVARQVSIREDAAETLDITPLLSTSEASFARSDMEINTIAMQESDVAGPIDVAVVSGILTADGKVEASVMAVGTANLVDSEIAVYNKDFILNAVNWQANSTQKSIIRPKSLVSGVLTISAEALSSCVIIVFLMPLIMLVMGLTVFLKRRRL
ncbi:MAG: Gldg family protein [Clostridiales bacterium]|jgi:ABC-2 type transport system permease protein|nr:Gldg family protein [Clostridiales bacterium]